ncbi:hypothetical protein [Allorhizocola rhizosphaerae]|uniref:hypothetical protein n=1 Tax=Allorhizocola rhizosphaerae TaxID=1872709 RepID=UPI000E3D121C|nr:hypothetical protein [Allorhizocola rhizosphaerae]
MQPAGPEASRVTQTYRVFEGDILVREAANESVTPLIRGDELLADIAASGLTATRHGENLLVLGFGNGQERTR